MLTLNDQNMSFILGINLSDRIYLSGDTRLTQKTRSGLITVSDNIVKVEPLSDSVSCVAAGDARLASALVNHLYNSNTVKWGIRFCRDDIKEVVASFVGNYGSFRKTVIIFGGLNLYAAKKITAAKLMQITTQYQEETGNSMNMKEVLFRGIAAPFNQRKPQSIIPAPDSHVFALKILPNEMVIEDIEWGDFAAYGGDGLSKESLPIYTFGELEVASNAGQYPHDNAILTALIKQTAEAHEAMTVGGAVTTLIMSGKGSGMLNGNVGRVNTNTGERDDYFSAVFTRDGRAYRKTAEGEEIELTPLKEFELPSGSAQLNI